MRKNYAQFKTNIFLAIIIFSLSLFTFSCKKDSQKITETPKEELIAKAKEFVLEKLPAENVSLTNALATVNMQPDWSKAKTILNRKNQLILGVPLQTTANTYSELNLIVIDGVSYSVIKNYTTNADGQQSLKFYLPNGSLLIEGAYSADTHKLRVSKMVSAPANLFGNRFIKSGSKTAMASVSTSTSAPTDDPDGDGIDLNDVTYTYTPPPPPPTPNTAEFPNNWDYGIGGTPSPTYPVDPIAGGNSGNPIASKKVEVDSNARDCVKNISAILESKAGSMYSCIGDMAGIANTSASVAIGQMYAGATYNIKISEKTIPDIYDTDNAGNPVVTTTNGSTNPLNGNITLNSAVLNESTDLGVAATMIHEMMHSYFLYGIKYATGSEKAFFQDMNSYLYDNNGVIYSDDYQKSQHEQMAATYVDSMASLLMAYAIANGTIKSPDSSISLKEYCKDIFWRNLATSQSSIKAPNQSRAENNGNKELKNTSGSSKKKGC